MGQAEPGLPEFHKILRNGVRRALIAANWNKLQAKVVALSIWRLWLMTRYFTGSVNWVTDLAPYLPQYVAGHYE
jgi:hypothetical protein